MQFEDDEILQGFIEESLEHLADIENDLLAIEESGANIDEDLVNKVFRAAHSIKGGAGFMGLNGIQELAHAMENVLGLIRSKKLIPNPEIVNVLLLGSDQLQSMIEDIQNSNDVDISSHIEPLNAIAEGSFQPETTGLPAERRAKSAPEPPPTATAEAATQTEEEDITSSEPVEDTSAPSVEEPEIPEEETILEETPQEPEQEAVPEHTHDTPTTTPAA
ncbi:MAG TPA: Hpt domain-containing protein, partial [Desulfopila sp.]|nr:Hpt domain-containing protein [Desulfopila sp.]